MKQVVYIKKEKGCVTPNTLAEECKKKGHLIGIDRDPFLRGVRKYYTLETPLGDKRPVEVTLVDDNVVSVRRVPETVIKTLPPLIPPQFGNF